MTPWIHEISSTRKAGVSAFGFGGSNFHITLEEYKNTTNIPKRLLHSPIHLMLFSAEDTGKLFNLAEKTLSEIPKDGIMFMAQKLQCEFNNNADKRLALIIDSESTFENLLKIAKDKILSNEQSTFSIPGKIYYGIGKYNHKLAYLFPGQGSQYVNMGLDLTLQCNEVRETWDMIAHLDFGTNEKLHEIVFPKPVFSESEKEMQSILLKKTKWAQPAIGVVSASYLRLLNQPPLPKGTGLVNA